MKHDYMKVFISLASEDRKFAESLEQVLKGKGVDVWVYYWEMKGGDSLIDKMNEGLGASDYLIAVLSRNSLSSHWVTRELNAGLMRESKHQMRVIPVIIDECKEQLPPLLQEKIYVDFRKDFADGFKELRRSLGLSSMVDQVMHKQGDRESVLGDDDVIETKEITAVKRGDKIYADFPKGKMYSEITDEETYWQNDFFKVKWDNLQNQLKELGVKDLSGYKIDLPTSADILEHTTQQIGSRIIEKFLCKFGLEFEVHRDENGKLLGFSKNEHGAMTINPTGKTISFQVRPKASA